MSNVKQFPSKTGHEGGGNHNGGSGGGSDLESRVATLEEAIPEIRERLVRGEMRLESIDSSMAKKSDITSLATKDDLNAFVRASSKDMQDLAVSFQKSLNDQTWKFITVATVLAGIAFTAARFIR